MDIQKLLDNEGKAALEEVNALVNSQWSQENNEGWQLPEPDQRITWALGKEDSKYIISILVDNDDGWAKEEAIKLKEKFPGIVKSVSTGEAYSSYPSVDCAPHATSRKIMPGVSIGHGRFRAGTMGCIVKFKYPEDPDEKAVKKKKQYIKGVLTAAHVVKLNDSVKLGDLIYSPGKPENGVALMALDAIGKLRNSVGLIPFYKADLLSQGDPYTSTDIALVDLEDVQEDFRGAIPKFNEVPDPKNPKNTQFDIHGKIKIKKIVKDDDLPNLLCQSVYKFGRTTGFTKGQLVNVMIMHRQLKLPNRKIYLYKELLAVKSTENGKSFSRPGDSGAMVYTSDGMVVGFVTGADDEFTLCCSAEKCFKALEGLSVQLVDNRSGL